MSIIVIIILFIMIRTRGKLLARYKISYTVLFFSQNKKRKCTKDVT